MALQKAQCLKAQKIELMKDFITKKPLEYLYVRYTINTNIFFFQVENFDF